MKENRIVKSQGLMLLANTITNNPIVKVARNRMAAGKIPNSKVTSHRSFLLETLALGQFHVTVATICSVYTTWSR